MTRGLPLVCGRRQYRAQFFTEAGMRSGPGYASRCATPAPRQIAAVTSDRNGMNLSTSATMKSVNELLTLFMRQAQLERAMKQPGGARIIEERELNSVRQKLAAIPDSMKRNVMAQEN
jgi:hypothetical protein